MASAKRIYLVSGRDLQSGKPREVQVRADTRDDAVRLSGLGAGRADLLGAEGGLDGGSVAAVIGMGLRVLGLLGLAASIPLVIVSMLSMIEVGGAGLGLLVQSLLLAGVAGAVIGIGEACLSLRSIADRLDR